MKVVYFTLKAFHKIFWNIYSYIDIFLSHLIQCNQYHQSKSTSHNLTNHFSSKLLGVDTTRHLPQNTPPTPSPTHTTLTPTPSQLEVPVLPTCKLKLIPSWTAKKACHWAWLPAPVPRVWAPGGSGWPWRCRRWNDPLEGAAAAAKVTKDTKDKKVCSDTRREVWNPCSSDLQVWILLLRLIIIKLSIIIDKDTFHIFSYFSYIRSFFLILYLLTIYMYIVQILCIK